MLEARLSAHTSTILEDMLRSEEGRLGCTDAWSSIELFRIGDSVDVKEDC